MKSVIIFLGGMAVGGLTSWIITNSIYNKKLSEVKNIYAELTAESKERDSKEDSKEELSEVITSAGYSSVNIPDYWEVDNPAIMSTANTEAPAEHPSNDPYLIAADRFEGDPKYDKHYLIYSTDQDELYEGDDAVFTVYDSKGEPEELTTTDILGEEFLEEALYIQGADIVHVRNENLQMDFEVEILR